MKKILLLLSTISSLFANGQVSVYHPFPDSNATWNFHFQWYCFANGTADEYYSISYSGDTIINSQSYHKLNTPFSESYSVGNCGGVPLGYRGAIRQDTALRKIYIVPPSDSTEQLLYDFTIHVGDTIRGYLDHFGLPAIVSSIDSVLIGNTYRNRWNLTCYGIQVIEGIGNTYGLIEYLPGCALDLPDWTLTCVQQNGQTLYPDSTTDCQLITSMQSIGKVVQKFLVFPNPSDGTFSIDIDPSIQEIRITDLLGHIVLHQQSRGQTIFRIQNLKSGTYILTLVDKYNVTTNKKIISCP